MTLEDHLGDVLRKARMMRGLSSAEVARAAGLTTAELESVEQTGACVGRLNYAALGAALGLRAAGLESVAGGWLPAQPDLGTWRELRRLSTSDGMEVHAYLVWDEVTREAAVFDTGHDAAPIFECVQANDLNLRHLFITHSHGDHIAGQPAIQQRFPKILVHTSSTAAPIQHRNRANECVQLGSLRITHRDTPGHAIDGVTYLIGNWPEDAPHVAVVGDAIFAGSMGGAPGSGDRARQTVRDQILALPPDTLICPGHGPLTTVAQERAFNPFF
jgi:glyoxylase-like metal-dependent hydrolase (beta-lactamase superfamily II)